MAMNIGIYFSVTYIYKLVSKILRFYRTSTLWYMLLVKLASSPMYSRTSKLHSITNLAETSIRYHPILPFTFIEQVMDHLGHHRNSQQLQYQFSHVEN